MYSISGGLLAGCWRVFGGSLAGSLAGLWRVFVGSSTSLFFNTVKIHYILAYLWRTSVVSLAGRWRVVGGSLTGLWRVRHASLMYLIHGFVFRYLLLYLNNKNVREKIRQYI
jgi:hypothetical protein